MKIKRRVGIDTGIFIRIYEQPYLLGYESSRIFNYKDIIFTHVICKGELIRKLKRKEGLSEVEAIKEVNLFVKQNNINVTYSRNCFIPEGEVNEFEIGCNKKFKEIGRDYLSCHKPDSIILLAFKNCGINKVISTDESFRECAKFLGMDGEGIPSFNSLVNKELRRIFGYKKRKRY